MFGGALSLCNHYFHCGYLKCECQPVCGNLTPWAAGMCTYVTLVSTSPMFVYHMLVYSPCMNSQNNPTRTTLQPRRSHDLIKPQLEHKESRRRTRLRLKLSNLQDLLPPVHTSARSLIVQHCTVCVAVLPEGPILPRCSQVTDLYHPTQCIMMIQLLILQVSF